MYNMYIIILSFTASCHTKYNAGVSICAWTSFVFPLCKSNYGILNGTWRRRGRRMGRRKRRVLTDASVFLLMILTMNVAELLSGDPAIPIIVTPERDVGPKHCV